MNNRPLIRSMVEAEARDALGDDACDWMAKPSRLLDGIVPAELAASPDGARVVLHELRKASSVRAALRKKPPR